jgi:hypothetical protein
MAIIGSYLTSSPSGFFRGSDYPLGNQEERFKGREQQNWKRERLEQHQRREKEALRRQQQRERDQQGRSDELRRRQRQEWVELKNHQRSERSGYYRYSRSAPSVDGSERNYDDRRR